MFVNNSKEKSYYMVSKKKPNRNRSTFQLKKKKFKKNIDDFAKIFDLKVAFASQTQSTVIVDLFLDLQAKSYKTTLAVKYINNSTI